MPQERDLIKVLFRNIINSLKPRSFNGVLIGKDNMGNSYYEIPKSSSQKLARYFNPSVKEDFEAEMPPEWESWLRLRRKDPPTEEEIMKNKAIADMKKINAIKIGETQKSITQPNPGNFPVYGEEFEVIPGMSKKRKN